MTGQRSGLLDRLLVATIAVLLWGAFAIWVCGQLGSSQTVRVAVVWAGIGAVLTASALLPRRRR